MVAPLSIIFIGSLEMVKIANYINATVITTINQDE